MAGQHLKMKAQWMSNMTEYGEITAAHASKVGFDVSSKDFTLADAMPHLSFDSPAVDWLCLDEVPGPLESLRHWMIERNNHFCTDDYITWNETLVFIVQEDLIQDETMAMVSVWDVYDQEMKLFVFRNLKLEHQTT
eukprot:s3000_g6.t1